MDLAEQLIEDIERFAESNGCDGWSPSGAAPPRCSASRRRSTCRSRPSRRACRRDHDIAPSQIYAYAFLKQGVPIANGAPNLSLDFPAMLELARQQRVPVTGKDFKTGQTLMKTILAPGLKARMLGVEGWYSTNILGNRDGEVLDDPESFKSKEVSKLGVLDNILQPETYPELYGDIHHVVRINYYPPRGDNKEGWDNIDIFGWLDTRCRSRSIPVPRLDPRGADRSRSRAVPRSRPARRDQRHPGVAELLLQEPRAPEGCTPSTICSSS